MHRVRLTNSDIVLTVQRKYQYLTVKSIAESSSIMAACDL
jgi:hypothetical protein